MKTITFGTDITVTMTDKRFALYQEYLKAEAVAVEAYKNYRQALHDVFDGNGEGYDRSDLYDWEEESFALRYKSWEAWDRFCA